MRTLDRRTAIITGASRGIGRSLALALGKAGAKIVLVARSLTVLEETVAEIRHQGSEVLTIPADVTDSAICPGLVDEAGIYARVQQEAGVETPQFAGSVSPDQVAQAMLRAIRCDLAELYVNSLPIRPMLLIQMLFPRMAEWLFPRLGADIYRHALREYEHKTRLQQ